MIMALRDVFETQNVAKLWKTFFFQKNTAEIIYHNSDTSISFILLYNFFAHLETWVNSNQLSQLFMFGTLHKYIHSCKFWEKMAIIITKTNCIILFLQIYIPSYILGQNCHFPQDNIFKK
jgi:hypothetical protein